MHAFTHSVFTRICFEMTIKTKIHQRAQSFIDHQYDITALTTITAGRSTIGYIFFSAERDHTVAAFTRFHIDRYLI